MEMYDFLFKIVIIGDSGVGKTNILKRFARNEFDIDTKSTIGVEFSTRTVDINGKIVKLQIWDTAGQERYRAITSAYYRGATGALLVYDVTQKYSFDNIKKWYTEIQNNVKNDIVIILIGNKADLKSVRTVSLDEGKFFANLHHFYFLETSALTGDNISDAFELLSHQLLKNKQNLDFDKKELILSDEPILLTTPSDIPPSKSCQC